MIETPLAFLEVEEKAFLAHAAQFEEAELGVAPEAFDPVDVAFSGQTGFGGDGCDRARSP